MDSVSKPFFTMLAVGLLAFYAAGHLSVLHRVLSISDDRKITPVGRIEVSERLPTRDLERIASAIAGRGVRVQCSNKPYDRGASGYAVWDQQGPGGKEVLMPYVCSDLGHFAALTDDEWRCVQRDGPSVCGGTVSQVLRAMHVIAHESWHLAGYRSELKADCYGLQSVPGVALWLGAQPMEAAAIGRYYADHYDQLEGRVPGYWSPECRSGGQLDLHPETPAWPD